MSAHRSRGRPSPFNPAQLETADAIVAMPEFSGENAVEQAHPKIVEMYRNRWNNTLSKSKKRITADTETTPKGTAATASRPLVAFSTERTGRQLFEEQHKDEIEQLADELQGPNSPTIGLACYQTALKQLWDGLDETTQASFNTQANENSHNIEANRAEFRAVAWQSLRELCQGGKLGDVEMLLQFAWRTESGAIHVGLVEGHCKGNSVSVKTKIANFETAVEVPWRAYTSEVLPRKTVKVAPITIGRNAAGIPVFPVLNLDDSSAAVLRSLLAQYLELLWAHSWPADSIYKTVPWAEINEDPDCFFDIELLPCRLNLTLTQLKPQQIMELATFFMETSTAASNHPFTFRTKADIMGIGPAAKTPKPLSNISSKSAASTPSTLSPVPSRSPSPRPIPAVKPKTKSKPTAPQKNIMNPASGSKTNKRKKPDTETAKETHIPKDGLRRSSRRQAATEPVVAQDTLTGPTARKKMKTGPKYFLQTFIEDPNTGTVTHLAVK
ncbi:hypothetical protein C8J57DRAFT_1530106 [Mycena rebaudengoi]|nr:hypothetical protein C8J57DRAFT_1530106 [Mycena rebaudengoi]